jgi:uncharacterized tellurite resistance protein B-like protein
VTPEQASAVYELMMITAWADGRLDMSENLVMDSAAAELPELLAVAEKERLAARAKQRLAELGLKAALREAGSKLGEQWHRELAFVCCARVLEADGIIAQEEFSVLIELRNFFGLKSDDVARLLRRA